MPVAEELTVPRLFDWKHAAVVLAVVMGLAGLSRLHQTDVAWCRQVFLGLLNGKLGVEKQIDWEHFTALGTDVGAEYRALANEQARIVSRVVWVAEAGDTFKALPVKGLNQAFNRFRWRLVSKTEHERVVAAEFIAPKGLLTLKFTISTDSGTRLLRSIELESTPSPHDETPTASPGA